MWAPAQMAPSLRSVLLCFFSQSLSQLKRTLTTCLAFVIVKSNHVGLFLFWCRGARWLVVDVRFLFDVVASETGARHIRSIVAHFWPKLSICPAFCFGGIPKFFSERIALPVEIQNSLKTCKEKMLISIFTRPLGERGAST